LPHIYPPAAPTLTGDTITISRFLNNPAAVARRLRTLAENRFIADVLLAGRYQVAGGSLLYEQSESIFTDKPPEVVNPGAEYPRSPATPGPAAMASVSKWGQDVPITDEHVGRYGRRAVDVALTKIVNYLVRQVDSLCLSAISAAVTATAAAGAGSPGGPYAWSTAGADPLLDLMLAKASIIGRDQGYEPDTAVMSDTAYARLIANSKIISGLAREGNNTVTQQGEQLTIAGLRILPSNNLPVAGTVFVLDSGMLGGIGFERIPSPEYNGDPAGGVETWSRRDPHANDQWIVRGRRPVVPVVQEPFSAYKITGV
jgi:hypothetical protein